MRLVPRPTFKPGHCAAVPFLGATATDERWVDTGSEMPGFDNHVYLSETAVREAGRTLGFPTIRQYEEALADLDRARAELAEAAIRLDELEDYRAAIQLVLRDDDLKQIKELAV